MRNKILIYKKIQGICTENRELIIGIVNSLFVKIGSLLVVFFTTPVYMRYFRNQAVLGIWFTLVSAFNMFLQFDLGIGNGLRNRLTETLAEDNIEKTKEYITSAYVFISIFILCVGSAFLIAIYFLPINIILNVSEMAISSDALKHGISICVIGLCGQCVFRLITSMYYALQKAAIPSFLLFLSNLFLLLVVLFAPKTGSIENHFIFLSVAHAVVTNIPPIVATVWAFRHELSKFIPSLKYFDLDVGKDLLKLGLTFFLLQAAGLLITNCLELLITTFVSPEKTVDYQVYYKIFSLPSTLFFLVLTPFWSAITKARAEKRYIWLRNVHKLVVGMIFLVAIGAFLLVPFVPFVVKIWLQEQASQVEILTKYSLWFAFWCGANMWLHGNCTFANGLEWMQVQKAMVLPCGLLNILGAYVTTRFTDSWLSILQFNIAILLLIGTVQAVFIHKNLNRLSEESKL